MLLHLLLPIGFTLSPLLGWLLDLPWLTLFIAMLVLPLLEWLFGRVDAHGHDPVNSLNNATSKVLHIAPNYRWQPWLLRSVMLMVLGICIGFTLHAPQLTAGSFWLLALSCGYVAGGIGIVLAHELGHRRPLIDRALARALLCWIGYGHYAIEHNRGHHRTAATLPDPATARQEESLWRFMPRYFAGVFIHAVRLSRQKPGRINEALALAVVSVLLGIMLALFASVEALGFALITAGVAQTLVATIDYVEHWGLQRVIIDGKPERMGPQHIWDCANRISDALLFNLPRHAAHHLEPSLGCNELRRISNSPQMPTGYAGMSLLSAIWPLYRHIMTPRLPSNVPTRNIVAVHA